MIKRGVILIVVIIFNSSCVAVKEYEKVKLSDPDMALALKKMKRFETAYQVYREAAAGANGGKSGGGCGCN